jgi:hypothetical protein
MTGRKSLLPISWPAGPQTVKELASHSRNGRCQNAGKIAPNYLHGLGNGQSASGSRAIPLDFSQHTTDTSITAFVTTLLRQFSHCRNNVQQGRTQPIHSARIEPYRITAAPPLMPFRCNAVLGRLLLFCDRPSLPGGHR